MGDIKKNDNKDVEKQEIKLDGILEEFRDSLKMEIETIKKNGQSSILLKNGKKTEYKGLNYFYKFGVEYLPNIPADTPCNLVIDKDIYKVIVSGFSENEIIISSNVELPANIGVAKLENGATILMERMINRIELNSDKANPAGKRMLNEYWDKLSESYHKLNDKKFENSNEQKLNTNQEKAVNSAIQNDITYIWGPPGTGKTSVIGAIIKSLYKSQRKVLIVSHTNTAVDGAIDKVKDLDEKDDCAVLRLGTSVKDLPDKVKIEYHNEKRGKELVERQKDLNEQEKVIKDELQKIICVLNKFEWISNQNVEEILNQYLELQKLNDEYNVSKKDFENVNNEYNNYINENEEVKEISKLENNKIKYQNEIINVENELKKKNEKYNKIQQLIKECDNEISMHNRYDVLKKQIDENLTEDFLRNKIQEIKVEIKEQEETKVEVETKIKEYDRLINLKSKSVFSNILNRNNIKHAEEQKLIEEKSLVDIKEEIKISKKMLEEYSNQLTNVISLNKQLNDVKPNKNKEDWSEEKSLFEKQLLFEEKEIKELENKKESFENSLKEIINRLEELSIVNKKYNEIKNKLAHVKDKFKNIDIEYSKLKNVVKEKIYEEKNRINNFEYIEKQESISKEVEKIKDIYGNVNEELKTINKIDYINKRDVVEKNLNTIQRELEEIKQKLSEIEKESIKNAKIIGTTLAKSYIDEILQECEFDTVILDEASMAPIPALWCASYLAKKNIVIVGDFLQLPPIAMSEGVGKKTGKKWLVEDIFEVNGIPEKIGNKTADENIVILDEQYRMEKEIADVANIYYGNVLKNGGIKTIFKEEDKINEFYKWYGVEERNKEAVEIIDTHNMHAWVTTVPQGKSSSRMNVFSAALCVEFAIQQVDKFINFCQKDRKENKNEIPKEVKVLIVAPYKPHIDQVNKMIKASSNDNINYEDYIKVGTIHSFQGNEADIVVFDLVVDEPHWRANLFLTDEDSEKNLGRLFNVAVTRAKFKLFIVGNIPYLKDKSKKGSVLDKLLEKLDKFNVIDGNTAFPDLKFVRDISAIEVTQKIKGSILCKEDIFFDYFLKDILLCKENLIIYSAFMTENRISNLLPYFKDAIALNKKIIIVTKALAERNKKDLYTYQKIEEELKQIGIEIIHKKGMHEKLIFIDDNIVWNGSLNVLSNTGSTGEIMYRINDKDNAEKFMELYNIKHLFSTVKNDEENYCPICNGRMELNEGANGQYWKCVNGDYTRGMDQKFPHNGVFKCHCGGEYEFFMKKEPRWICTLDNKHFAKIKLSDLKLPKMVEKIDENEYKKVEEFFDCKVKLKDIINQKGKNKSNIKKTTEKQISLFEENDTGKVEKIKNIESVQIDKKIKDTLIKQISAKGFEKFDYKTLLDLDINYNDVKIIDKLLKENNYIFSNEFVKEYSFESLKESLWFYKLLKNNGITEENIKSFNLLLLLKDVKNKTSLKAYLKKYFKMNY